MKVTVFVIALSIALLPTAALAETSASRTAQTETSRLAFADEPMIKGSRADVPGLMNFQGTLTDEYGVALDTTVAMTFSIYTDSIGGAQVWTETQPSVAVASGLFNVLLGSVNVIRDTVFSDPVRWLGVQVGADSELSPRQRIAAVGYAFWAAEADTANYARGASAVSDGDWTIVGDDIYHEVGNVGIANTSPTTALHVGTSPTTAQRVQIEGLTIIRTNGSGQPTLLRLSNLNGLANSGGSLDFQGLNSGASPRDAARISGFLTDQSVGSEEGILSFSTNDAGDDGLAERVRIDQDGNVGIGTTNPGASLEVLGSGIANHLMLTNTTSVGPAMRLNAANRDWVIMGSNPGSSVGDQKLVFRDYSAAQDRMVIDQNGNVGIGTTSPAAKLDVRGTLNVGQDDTGHDVNFYGMNSGSRLFWDESKMALRAGQAFSGQWDDANVGNFSFAVGDNPTASGWYAVAMGYGPSAGGFGATATGWLANASGYVSTAMGSYATSAGPWSVAIGKYVMADSSEAFVLGSGISLIDPLVNDIESSLMVAFNDTTPTLFVGGPDARVGIGTDSPEEKLDVDGTVKAEGFKMPTGASDGYILTSDPSGAGSWQPADADGDWTVSGNHIYSAVPGSVGVGTTSPAAKLDVYGTVKVGTDGIGYDVTFHGEEIGSGFFWDEAQMALRAGRDDDGTHWLPDSIGLHSLSTGLNTRASGHASAALGNETIASGPQATALGTFSMATGGHSLATGFGSEASGLTSTAMGNATDAIGASSTAMGSHTTASEVAATAMGSSTTASGIYSTAMGAATTASGYSSTAMGLYTAAMGSTSVAIGKYLRAGSTNSIVLGTGKSSSDRLNNYVKNSLMVAFDTTSATLFIGGSHHRVGVGTTSPSSRFTVKPTGTNWKWDQGDGWGDFSVGDGTYGLSIGVADGGGGAGAVALWPRGGIERINFGTPTSNEIILTIHKDGNVGVGTEDPAAKLDVRGTLNVGVDDTGSDVSFYGADSGSRLFWDESKMAFRAGRDSDGTHWVSDSVGIYSLAMGYDTKATGDFSTVAGGWWNTASDTCAFVGGGYSNDANGQYSFVGSGWYNTTSSFCACVGGGAGNDADGLYATIGGGYHNDVSNHDATVSGGANNVASATHATVGGGGDNTASDSYATVSGGKNNTASGYAAAVSGGWYNAAIGDYAFVGGGATDTSEAFYSFTAGYQSKVPAPYSNSVAFNGQVASSSGQTRVGTISKASGTFTIDHPLDPTNKILNHYFVESPEMVLIYRGVARIGSDGRARVQLPDYFDALNRNPMIQLTGVGTSDVYVAEKVTGNRFVIGGKPGTEVYWTVTGERQDQSAEITRILMPVEQPKEEALAGRSLDDDFLAATMSQLERMGQGSQFNFRTQAGRARYEGAFQTIESRPPLRPQLSD